MVLHNVPRTLQVSLCVFFETVWIKSFRTAYCPAFKWQLDQNRGCCRLTLACVCYQVNKALHAYACMTCFTLFLLFCHLSAVQAHTRTHTGVLAQEWADKVTTPARAQTLSHRTHTPVDSRQIEWRCGNQMETAALLVPHRWGGSACFVSPLMLLLREVPFKMCQNKCFRDDINHHHVSQRKTSLEFTVEKNHAGAVLSFCLRPCRWRVSCE